MACFYIYKNHKFNSELELDQYLIEKKQFESQYGDLVFSRTTSQNGTCSILDKVSKDSADIKAKYESWRQANKIKYNEDGEESLEEPPYIGVNKFLAGVRIEGNRLFPEFIEDNYWNGRYANWKLGQFTELELEEFGFDSNNPPKLTDGFEQLRKQIEFRWEMQAKNGTAVHNVLQLCFTMNNDSIALNLPKHELIDFINNNLEKSNKKFLTPDIIDQTIEYAKKLHEDLKYKFGDNLLFYPEFTISQDTNQISKNGQPTKLLGIIDLLVIDQNGKAHILDYKTSTKGYESFSDPKKLTYSYQLATYSRMLEKYGLNMNGSELLVAPIKLDNFRKEGNTYVYDSIYAPNSFVTINTSYNNDNLWRNIDEFMPAPFIINANVQDAQTTISEYMSEWYPDYSTNQKITRESIINILKKYNLLVPDENGIYTYKKFGKKEEPITATSESEFVDKVLKYEEGEPARRIRYTGQIKQFIKESIKNGINNTKFPSPSFVAKDGERTWLRDTLKPYTDGNWEIVDNEVLENYGMIMLKTIDGSYPQQIDFVRVSTHFLRDNYRKGLSDKDNNKYKNRGNLIGTYESDVLQKSKSGNLSVEALFGNVELMEALLVINQINGLEGHTIGNIQVINPKFADSMKLSNEELLYNFNELNRYKPLVDNKFKSGKVKFATKYELLITQLNNIIKSGDKYDWKDEYKGLQLIKSVKPIIDQNISGDNSDKIVAIQNLLKSLQSDEFDSKKYDLVYTKQSELSQVDISLYNTALLALADLKGIKLRQQVEDHDKWIESINIFRHGVSGNRIDNPGNLDSENLNLITQLVSEAYQNTRDTMQQKKLEIQKLVEEFKKEKSFGALQENTIGNQASLYSNMYEQTANGDFVFKNPNRLSGAEKKLLEYALYVINKNRYNLTDEELEIMKNNNDIQYYRVPLAIGGLDSVASVRGLMSSFKASLQFLNPKTAFDRAQKKLEGIYYQNERDNQQLDRRLNLFYMTNYFDRGEKEDRLEIIKREKIENLEHNLETLLLKHIFAYTVKDNMDSVFPLIKASMIHIATQGAMQNTEFSNDISYLEDYIKNKIKNEDLTDPRLKTAAKYAGVIKSAASKLTLAFAPVQMTYQTIQSLWQDISLIIRKPDGKDSFTIKNFAEALKTVYKDLGHYSDTPTLCSSLNELFGINDMDMNTYVDRISSAKKGLFWNFDNFAFKFSSRPDYYSRMSIFISRMKGDGCFNAVSIKNGKLEYDWKADKRYEAFANGWTNDPRYNEQKSLYYVTAKQFELEHTKNPDGSEFKLNMSKPMPLPRVYTNKEAEAIKAIADEIYGYYSHEKKSMILSYGLGAMWLQFKTYWSAKKNQYLQPGGVRLKGQWKHYQENGEKMYYQVDKNGDIRYDLPPTNQVTIAPVVQWEGIWQEGIILTLSDLAMEALTTRSLRQAWKNKWYNSDENLRLAYRNNIKQAAYDSTMFIVGGLLVSAALSDWLKELIKENKKSKDLETGVMLAAANIAVMSVKSSFSDFNAFKSVYDPIGNWTPFSLEWSARFMKNWWNVAMGDEDFYDGVVKSSGALKQVKPLLDVIKPEFFNYDERWKKEEREKAKAEKNSH